MNDDLEPILEQLAQHGPPPALRTQVLAAVDRELTRSTDRRWSWTGWHARSLRRAWRWCTGWPTTPFAKPQGVPPYALAAAAALLVSVALSYWADRSIDARLAQVVGPAPPDREAMELANEIAAVTDAETGRWIYDRVISSRDQAPVPIKS